MSIAPEAGIPPFLAARLKKLAYGMNDAPRRWWNILDKALCSYGMVPMRADRCWERSLPKDHEDHIAGKGISSLNHYNLLHKLINEDS